MALVALPDPNDKSAVVEAMFDRIAPRYDRLNRLLTLRLDQSWRRRLIAAVQIGRGDRVVDLGCGTGDLLDLAAATGAIAFGVDFSAGMLAAARRRNADVGLLRADAARLPFADGIATVVTSAFMLRNLVAIPPVLRETARLLVPGGSLALIEVDEPRLAVLRWGHAFYFRRVVPLVGGLLSDRWAYSYLPQSTAYLPPIERLRTMLAEAGFEQVTKIALSGGIAQLVTAVRREEP